MPATNRRHSAADAPEVLHTESERKPEGERLIEECAQNIVLCAASICPEARSRVTRKAVGVAGGWHWVAAAG